MLMMKTNVGSDVPSIPLNFDALRNSKALLASLRVLPCLRLLGFPSSYSLRDWSVVRTNT